MNLSREEKKEEEAFDPRPTKSNSSGGIEDLQIWLKIESEKKYMESLGKLNLDKDKI